MLTPDFLYGRNPVQLFLLKSPRKPVRLWIDRTCDAQTKTKFTKLARGRNTEIRETDRTRLNRMSGRGVHQGVVLEAHPLALLNAAKLAERARQAPCAIVTVDSITDPQNFGAICRTAEAMGSSGILFERKGAPPLGGAAYKASAGAMDLLNLYVTENLRETIQILKTRGVWTVGLDAGARKRLPDIKPQPKTCLIFGSEDRGIRPAIRELCDDLCVIPMKGRVGSLNVSAAAAAALFWWSSGLPESGSPASDSHPGR